MSHGIYSALSGALAQSVSLEVTATNLANTTTTGYRAFQPVFHDVLARATTGAPPAHFAVVRRTGVNLQPGTVRVTDRPLDVALPPDAFLAVQTAGGESYTRAGSLEVSSEGLLVTKRGEPVLDENEEVIEVGHDLAVEVSEDGRVTADGELAGHLRMVTFDDPRQMTYQGGALLVADAQAGEPIPSTQPLKLGQLEESNSTPVKGMTDLMMATRMFEAMQRAIQTFRDVDQRLVTTVPK